MTKMQIDLPTGWHSSTVGEIAPADRRPANGVDAELPYIGLEQIEAGTGKILEVLQAAEAGAAFKFDERHILYGKLRPYLNKVALPDFRGRCTTEAIPLLCKSGMERRYVAAFLRRPETVSAAMRENTGSQMPRADMRAILALPIPIPPHLEQRRIADQMDEAMAEIVGVRAALEQQVHMIRAAVSAAASAAFDRLSVKYPGRRLGSFGTRKDSFRDGPFGSKLKTVHYSGSGVRVIRLQNIGDSDFLNEDKAFIPFSHYETIKTHGVEAGDVLVAALGDDRSRVAGRACIMPDLGGPAVVKADCFRIRLPVSEIGSAYITHYLNSPATRARLLGSTRGATRPRINLSMLREVEIPDAPVHLQREVAEHLDQIAATAADARLALSAQSAALDALPASLINAAFRGGF